MADFVTSTQVYEYSVKAIINHLSSVTSRQPGSYLFIQQLLTSEIRNLVSYLLLLASCLLSLTAEAQTLSTSNKKAQEFYEKGQVAFQARKVEEAFNWFEKSVEKDPSFAEGWLRLGNLYELTRQYGKSLELYQKSIELNPELPALTSAYQFVGNSYLRNGQYKPALKYFEKQLSLSPTTNFLSRRVSRQIETCHFAIDAIQKPYVLNVKPLSQQINRFVSQYFPVLTADRETLIFTATEQANQNENLYVSRWKDNDWSAPTSLSSAINTPDNEGTCSISADGRTLVFTACQGRKGFGNCDLFISYRQGNEWSEPQNLGKDINSAAWESQPSLSADGRMLYFVSDRPGGLGRRDIWVSHLDSLGEWLRPVNLGKAINTTDDELSPFIHANGKTLFFSSEGHIGMGGLDIFFSELDNGQWSKPQNLGYPINTHEDQVALFITADGKKGYYSLEESQEIGKRNAKLYEFDLPHDLEKQFRKANYLKGLVLDVATKKSVQASVELYNLKTNQIEAIVQSDETSGEYATVLNDGGEYAVFVSREGYFFKSLSFDYSQQTDVGGKQLNILLEPLVKNSYEILNNIFFETGKFELEEKSKAELEKLVKLLKINPSLRLEISGHTDDVGKDAENLALSRKRALAVGDYLVQAGIEIQRIKCEGYGKTHPFMPNTSDENRRRNRRIEVKIL